MDRLPGVCAGRYDIKENKYYIKVWLMRYKDIVIDILNKV